MFLRQWVLYAELTQAGCLFALVGGGVLGRVFVSLAPGINILLGLVYWPVEQARFGKAILFGMYLRYDVGLAGLGALGWLINLIPLGR